VGHKYHNRDEKEWLVRTTEEIQLVPRAKQLIVCRIKLPKRRCKPDLVCIKPALIPLEGVMLARKPSKLIAKTNPPSRQQISESDTPKKFVHIMVANFSQEELALPKATILGVAEEVSAGLVAAINDGRKTIYTRHCRDYKQAADRDESFKQYLNDSLGHVSQEETAEFEQVLIIYRHVFYDEEKNDFGGTDVIEHRIITGDAATPRFESPHIACRMH
jgi:hypothetical protein